MGNGSVTATMRSMYAPPEGDTWVGIAADVIPVAGAYDWSVLPDCGAVVLFSGTVRDHADGRDGVQSLTYEAYEEQAVPKLRDIADEIRLRWPTTGRIALLHRVGQLQLEESSVVVVVSSPHRPEARPFPNPSGVGVDRRGVPPRQRSRPHRLGRQQLPRRRLDSGHDSAVDRPDAGVAEGPPSLTTRDFVRVRCTPPGPRRRPPCRAVRAARPAR